MSLETILRIGREILPDCVLSGYVDLELGMMLGVGSETPVPQAEIDNLGSAIVSMFDAK